MATKYKRVATLAQIKQDPRVDEIWSENDGFFDTEVSWWCYLKPGFQYDPQCHTIHEATIKDICNILNKHVTVWENDPELKMNVKS